MINVLTIGPDYRTLKGGIASVLEVYAKYDKSFTFLPTYSSENNLKNVLLFPLNYLKIIWFLLTKPTYKIVHIHGSSRISFYRKYIIFLTVKYLLRRKVVYHVHSGTYHLFESEVNSLVNKMIHHMVDSSDVVICLSDRWKIFFETTFNQNRVVVLNNTIFMPSTSRTIKDDNIIRFLFLGKIVEGKGIFDLLKILAKNREYFTSNIKMFIGGDGEVQRLKKEIEKLKMGDFVEYVGWASGTKKEELLLGCDVYVLPSYNEGLPISILEAMSYKKPIISTGVGGIPTIVKENINGKVIKPGDKDALFDSMKYFLENQSKIDEFGEKSFEMVQDFLPEIVIQDLHAIYEGLEK